MTRWAARLAVIATYVTAHTLAGMATPATPTDPHPHHTRTDPGCARDDQQEGVEQCQ